MTALGGSKGGGAKRDAPGDPVIEIRDVVKRFTSGRRTVTALDHFSASVHAGQITGLVGPDGAGKTTLMRLVAGLLKPDSGGIRVLGIDSVERAQEIQSRLGYMPQRFGLYEDLTVDENFEFYADLQGVAGAQRRARFERLMAFTGLAPFRKRLAGQLSGGMKQKLGLACALVRRPRLLLLDEPSVGVDPVSRRELWQIVQTLLGEGISVLWSTAYLDEAERCHEVFLINEGRLLAGGPPGRLSEGLAGRTFALPIAGADKRVVFGEVLKMPQVIDAVIQGREVHLLTTEAADASAFADLAARMPALGDPRPVTPAFEDAFIALLRAESAAGTARFAEAKVAAATPPTGTAAATPENRESVIAVEGLVRVFGDFRAVDGIDFQVGRGEIFGLLGPNGAGKSTTFKMLCGLLPPSDGKALVLGIDLRRAAARARARIGYMAQKFSLYGNMSVLQNLGFFASAYGLRGNAKRDKIDREMEEFGLVAHAEAISGDLPLGYKQRLALACAIMHEPGVLFLDEPTSGVDPLVRREFWSRINAMAAAGVTVMVTTHFMEEAEYCDRIGIIYRGKVVASGSPDALKAAPRTAERPNPTLEDAFIDLIETYDREHPL
jgi:ABC-2 type transport system ATP-binding protein